MTTSHHILHKRPFNGFPPPCIVQLWVADCSRYNVIGSVKLFTLHVRAIDRKEVLVAIIVHKLLKITLHAWLADVVPTAICGKNSYGRIVCLLSCLPRGCRLVLIFFQTYAALCQVVIFKRLDHRCLMQGKGRATGENIRKWGKKRLAVIDEPLLLNNLLYAEFRAQPTTMLLLKCIVAKLRGAFPDSGSSSHFTQWHDKMICAELLFRCTKRLSYDVYPTDRFWVRLTKCVHLFVKEVEHAQRKVRKKEDSERVTGRKGLYCISFQ